VQPPLHRPEVWNKQRKDEILLDVNDVALGYETRMRWNEAGRWVWSDAIVHEPLISAADFEAARAIMADAGRARRTSRETHQRVTHPYVLRGRLYCGYCGRRMQGQYSNQAPYYRCRYPRQRLPPRSRPAARHRQMAPVIFAPHRLEQTIREMQTAQDPGPRTAAPVPAAEDTQALIADRDTRPARYQAALDAGADPQAVAEWPRQVKSERVGALTARRS
jgi:site-specific DNA recombinase